jgi:CARDB protein
MRRLVAFLCGFTVALGAAAPAHAAVKLGQAALLRCSTGVAVFEGRVTPLRRAAKTQMRFTLEARTPEEPQWQRVPADGFGTWITAPPKVGRYLYDKTVEELIAPADYRAVVQFRWRDAKGHTLRSERAVSKVCRQPDPRPDLEVSSLTIGARYVALLTNSGRGDAGPFSVAFTHNGEPLGTVSVDGLAAGATTRVALTASACAPGELIAAQADSGDAVDEADEGGNVLSVTC